LIQILCINRAGAVSIAEIAARRAALTVPKRNRK